MLHVHFSQSLSTDDTATLTAHLPPAIKITSGTTEGNFHILISGRPSRADVEGSANLHTVIVPWTGIPPETRQLLLEFPHIAVHNTHHHADIVAEYTLALLLATAKVLVPMDRALRQGDWRPRYRPNPSLLLTHSTALILGYGAIGRHVGRLCQGIGMNVIGIRRTASPDERDGTVPIYGLDQLHRLLPQADALMVCLPLTEETEGVIGSAEIALLPSSAIIINIGRGAIIVEEALYQALRDNRIHGAGLDVWYNYPTDKDSRATTFPANLPFHELDNVVLSPHRAGGLADGVSRQRRLVALAKMLSHAANGDPIPNHVNLRLGY